MSNLTFPYLTAGGAAEPQPFIPVTLFHVDTGEPLHGHALVDSGADRTFIPSDVADALGLRPIADLDGSIRSHGEVTPGAFASDRPVALEVGGIRRPIAPVVLPVGTRHSLCLGQLDFFRHFRVEFDARGGGRTTLTPYDRPETEYDARIGSWAEFVCRPVSR